ncbi:MAG: PEP/pyruvate-binding domain-containing protein [Bacteroidota bacterium]
MPDCPLILTPDDVGAAPPRRVLGGKAAALAALCGVGRVPRWFVATPAAFEASLDDDARAAFEAARENPETLAGALAGLVPAPAVREALAVGLAGLGAAHVAVRSSAADEDGEVHSFAGQLASYLFVPPERVAERVADVWRSGFAPSLLTYRRERGLPPVPPPPAVLVQVMIEAETSGVAFSADPVSGDRTHVVIAAVHGLGAALVDGREDGEHLRVAAGGRVAERGPGRQRQADRFDAEAGKGVRALPAPSGPVLTDAQAARVADLARAAEAHTGCPQDVEWAFAGGGLYLLQSRPITALTGSMVTEGTADEGTLRLWDNSNIVESYGGVTTPLTYTFARRAYEAVYRHFCRLLGVSEPRIAAHDEAFTQMIGLVRGRVYYNLVNWYRVLALLPGYRLNAPLMERMMGVKEGLPETLRPDPPSGSRWGDALDTLRTVIGLVAARRRLPRLERAFRARLDAALALPGSGLDALDLEGLAAHYRRLDTALLARWDAPLVNDFFAMIHFGVAQRLAERWLPEGLFGQLLTGDGAVVSAEPARWVRRLAERAAEDAGWTATLADGPVGEIETGLAARPDWAAEVAAYLDRFGDRCLEELKLESPTLADDPGPLYRAIGVMAQRLRAGQAVPETAGAGLRAEAETRLRTALGGHPLRRLVFGWALRHARARVRDRENLRFERTRVFGRARRIVLAMGRRLAEAGRLGAPRDVFYLELHELLGLADGTATVPDPAALARARRAAFGRFRALPAPPERFTTRGAVALSALTPVGTAQPDQGGAVRQGLGCCPGTVEGPVRVVRDPRGVTLAPGTVLVAERTDPGWILLFPACAGLVVERGSLLSHSAIVARELGLPAAVAVAGVTGWLRDGDRVRLDGATGRVERLAANYAPGPVGVAHG